MNRTGRCAARPIAGLINGGKHKRNGNLVGGTRKVDSPSYVGVEQSGLNHSLVGVRGAELGRPVSGQHNHRHPILRRLDHRGQQIGNSRAGGGHDGGRLTGCPSHPQRKKADAALIKVAVGPRRWVSSNGLYQRRTTRPRRETEMLHAIADQLIDDRGRPGGIGMVLVAFHDFGSMPRKSSILFSISSHSCAGTEPSTIPAPEKR